MSPPVPTSEVTEAINGRDALDRLTEVGRFDLVMVDWNMPEMDGISFIKAVRAQATYAINHCGLDAVLNLFT